MYASETIQNCKNPTGHVDTLKQPENKFGCTLFAELRGRDHLCHLKYGVPPWESDRMAKYFFQEY